MRLMRRVIRALLAAALIAGIVIGVPVVLWAVGRHYFPDRPPAATSVVEALTRPDDGTVLLGFLTLVAACAWLALTVSIISEIVAAIAHRPAPRIELPGFRLSRSIAAALVAAVIGSGPAIAAPAAAYATVVASAPLEMAPAAGRLPEPAAPMYEVAPRDSLWRIAETVLGNPLRWREIYELNAGRVQPDGSRLTEASVLVVGWQLILPADAPEVLRVKPGDTLTGLAAEHLGDPRRADELYAANKTVIADPDLLRPGWTLKLPQHAEPKPPPIVAGPPTATEPSQSQTTPTPGPTLGTSTAPASPTPTAAQTDPGEHPSSDSAAPIAVVGASSLVVGGILTALAIRRRRQLRLRPAQHRAAVPTDEPGRTEWAVRQTAVEAAPATMSAARLDAALRSLPHTDIGVPRVQSVRLATDSAVITLADGMLPPPFIVAGERTWELHASEAPSVEGTTGYGAPYPTLVSIGTDDADRTLLIDLEQRVVLRIGGNPARVGALLRHLAAELATSRTAEDVEVLLVGLGNELTTLNPDRLSVEVDLAAALAQVEHRAAATEAAVQQSSVPSVVAGRLRHADDAWLPTVVLAMAEPDPAERAQLDELAAKPADTTAVAVVVFDPLNAQLRITDDGVLELPDVDDGPWKAVQLTENAGSHVAALLGATSKPAVPVEPATNPDAWADGMNEDGSISTPAPPPPDPAVPEPRTPEPELEPDPESARLLAIVDHQDSHLDDDLRTWHDDSPPSRPMIAILGEPDVRAPGTEPEVRRNWFIEILVYLTLHPLGVTTDKALTDLWPEGRKISVATVRHAFHVARHWAGKGFDGDLKATFVTNLTSDSNYRLRGHLLDWDLFRRLRKRGQARHRAHHPGAVDDYEAALALIRGPVLSALRPNGYAWLNNHDQRHDLQIPAFVIDTAHELVDIALDADDTALARRTAELARSVDSDVVFDQPLTDLMRIAHAENNHAEVDLYATILLDARDLEVPEDLAKETFAVFNKLLPNGPRRPRP